MTLAIVGDLHGKIDLMIESLKSTGKKIDAIIQVGDFGIFIDKKHMDKASRKHDGVQDFPEYYDGKKRLEIPTFFVKGNHEDFSLIDTINKAENKIHNLNYMNNGETYEIFDLKIGALGGNYSPVRYPLKKTDPNFQGPKRKHFNYQEIESLINKTPIDIIIAHDAPSGIGITNRYNQPCGSDELRKLIEIVQPKYYFFGHYHYFHESNIGNTKTICLDKINGKSQSIYLLE